MKKSILIINIYFFLLFCWTYSFSYENKIVYKINNEIITSFDINKEEKYLIKLSPKLNKISNKELTKLAITSIINEKIKIIELKKYFKFGDNSNNQNLNNIIKDLYLQLNFSNLEEFEKYLKQSNLELEWVKSKIEIENLWNNLIYNKYSDRLIIDEIIIKEEIKKNIKENQNIKNYFLSEILIKNKKNLEIEKVFKDIEKSIKDVGFNNTANIFSHSSSAKIGGKIGWIRETSLSSIINENLKTLKKDEYTKPIKISNDYIILKIEEIKLEKKEIDFEKIFNQRVNYEKNIQLDKFSIAYFNRIKQNIEINEL